MSSPKRLLVVDDDIDFADSVADLLRAEGHHVRVAYGGEAAVRLAREHYFDVTLVDMQMPGLDGVGSLRAILDIRPSAQVVMMTGYSVAERLGEAVAIGASSVLHKPLDVERLRALVATDEAPRLVLVVEDDMDFAESLRGILEHSGYTVMSATSGADGVRHAMRRRPDLLLLDLRMPGMDGREMLQELAGHGVSLPTIVLSAYVEDGGDPLDEGLRGVPSEQIVRKPVETGRLLELVGRVAGVA